MYFSDLRFKRKAKGYQGNQRTRKGVRDNSEAEKLRGSLDQLEYCDIEEDPRAYEVSFSEESIREIYEVCGAVELGGIDKSTNPILEEFDKSFSFESRSSIFDADGILTEIFLETIYRKKDILDETGGKFNSFTDMLEYLGFEIENIGELPELDNSISHRGRPICTCDICHSEYLGSSQSKRPFICQNHIIFTTCIECSERYEIIRLDKIDLCAQHRCSMSCYKTSEIGVNMFARGLDKRVNTRKEHYQNDPEFRERMNAIAAQNINAFNKDYAENPEKWQWLKEQKGKIASETINKYWDYLHSEEGRDDYEAHCIRAGETAKIIGPKSMKEFNDRTLQWCDRCQENTIHNGQGRCLKENPIINTNPFTNDVYFDWCDKCNERTQHNVKRQCMIHETLEFKPSREMIKTQWWTKQISEWIHEIKTSYKEINLDSELLQSEAIRAILGLYFRNNLDVVKENRVLVDKIGVNFVAGNQSGYPFWRSLTNQWLKNDPEQVRSLNFKILLNGVELENFNNIGLLEKVSGIYGFFVEFEGKNHCIYIGESKNMKFRILDHLYQIYHFPEYYAYKNEIGIKVKVLEEVENIESSLRERERFWINELRPWSQKCDGTDNIKAIELRLELPWMS